MPTSKDDPETRQDEFAREKRAEEVQEAISELVSGEPAPPLSPRELTDRAAEEKGANRPRVPFKKR